MGDEGDEKYVKDVLDQGRDILVFWTPVRINNAKKLSVAPEDRTLALGRFRMYILKKKQLRISQHLADLQRIKATEPVNEVWLYFKAATLVVRTPKADVFIAHLQQLHHAYFPASTLKVEVTAPSKIADLPDPEPQPAGGFHETYRSICNYIEVPLREDVYWDIKNIFPANEIRTLNVREFDLLEPQDFKALVLSLHYNGSYFTGLVAKNFRLSSAQLAIICDLLSHASYLEVLVLARNGPVCKDAGLATLSEAFLRNKQLSLKTINISENGVDDKGCRSFGKALSLCIGDSLRKLKLSGWTSVSGKAWQGFFSEIKANARLSATLTKLNLSNNKLSDEASQSLSSFLSQTHKLEHLNLSNSGVNLETICDALPLGCSNLQELIFSGNRFNPKKDLYHLVSFLSSSSKLTLFDVSATQLGIEPLKQILRAVSGNLALQNLTLRLSENKLGALAANLIAHMAGDFVNLECLDLTDTDLGDEGVAYLTEGLVKNKCLRSLKLGKNMKTRTKYRAVAVKNIIALIESPCPLIALSLEGGKDLQLREDIAPLLLALGSNETLASLDISGHAFSNFGAAILSKSLQVNCVLKRLWMDENNVTLQGLQMLAVALERNDSLHFLPTPILDISAALRNGEDPKALSKAMLDIERAIFVNLEGRQAVFQSSEQPPSPASSVLPVVVDPNVAHRKSGALMSSTQDLLARPDSSSQRRSKSLKNMPSPLSSPDAPRRENSKQQSAESLSPPRPSSPQNLQPPPRRSNAGSIVRHDPLTETLSKSPSRPSKRPPSMRNNGKKIPLRPGPSTAGVDGEAVLLPDLNPGFASPRPNIARAADKLYEKPKPAEDDDV